MYHFEDFGILTGYIKQLLSSFNLPSPRIYLPEYEEFYREHRYESLQVIRSFSGKDGKIPLHVPYIKEGLLQEYLDGEWVLVGQSSENQHWHHYDRGMKLLNASRTLQVKNNIYDSYTHEYLGDYLRFIRDYDRINLMPLYNCFSNTRSTNLNLSIAAYNTVFDASDTRYAIYSIPVRLFQDYTIAIDCDQPIECCCSFASVASDGPGLTGTSTVKQLSDKLSTQTYMRYPSSHFSQPVLFTGLGSLYSDNLYEQAQLVPQLQDTLKSTEYYLAQLAQRERDLRLFIKVPTSSKSTVSVLEGNYCGWNDISYQLKKLEGFTATSFPVYSLQRTFNTAVVSDDAITASADLNLPTNLQLLQFNTGRQVPFADRLIEYLLGNCITGNEEEPHGNIALVKTALGISNSASGWLPAFKKRFYRNLTTNPLVLADDQANHDLLGYVDKDVEKYFKGAKTGQSMLTIDIEEVLNK